MITDELKKAIVASLAESRQLFDGSDTKFAISLGINQAQYNRIKNGDTTRVLAEAVWITLARRQGISINNAPAWKIANTPIFQFITAQLTVCQEQGLSSLLCDLSDIGKTETARYYCRNNKNAVYVDCSQVKSKQKLIRFIAKAFGVGYSGKYADVYEDLVFYLKTLPNPIIILDEAGDLDYSAFLELKALWNAVEYHCAFYMMGAEGLQEKMRRGIDGKKVGFTEIFSRFNKKYGSVFMKPGANGEFIPMDSGEKREMLMTTAAMIARANARDEKMDVNKIVRQTIGDDDRPSLRRIRTKISTAE